MDKNIGAPLDSMADEIGNNSLKFELSGRFEALQLDHRSHAVADLLLQLRRSSSDLFGFSSPAAGVQPYPDTTRFTRICLRMDLWVEWACGGDRRRSHTKKNRNPGRVAILEYHLRNLRILPELRPASLFACC